MTHYPLNSPNAVILPGATIGILGGGQLGRMMSIAAKQMGYRVHVYSPENDTPAGQVSDLEVQASFKDRRAIEAFAKRVDVVTLETENLPLSTLDVVSQFAPVFPGRKALAITQNRGFEKQFLVDHQVPTSRFKLIHSLEELQEACHELELPLVAKATKGGYDGKGQFVIRSRADISAAWSQLGAQPMIVEQWINYDFEFSIIGARNVAGLFTAFPSIRNEHREQILDVSVSPSRISKTIEAEATLLVMQIMDQLDAVGVLTVEFFYVNGKVMVNEIAPRPHNSGHLTLDAFATDQFEQHIRAVCGLMLGSTQQLKPAAMANVLGDQWSSGPPKWQLGLSLPNTKLHLYGKEIPDAKRKMGHMTALADSPEQARKHVLAARKLLTFLPARKTGETGRVSNAALLNSHRGPR
ncbi:5-(carboxyamino)imidazole ribonucleotide synthase [bacterium]|nr:5-(carboxyamino)imidazole ribonucleotide synthase [bacterium]